MKDEDIMESESEKKKLPLKMKNDGDFMKSEFKALLVDLNKFPDEGEEALLVDLNEPRGFDLNKFPDEGEEALLVDLNEHGGFDLNKFPDEGEETFEEEELQKTVVGSLMDSNATEQLEKRLMQLDMPMLPLQNIWAREVFQPSHVSEARNIIEELLNMKPVS